jgi:hypothetical protein
MELEKKIYYDCIEEESIEFFSDAPQHTVKALEFTGDWCIVRKILIGMGYTIMDKPNLN